MPKKNDTHKVNNNKNHARHCSLLSAGQGSIYPRHSGSLASTMQLLAALATLASLGLAAARSSSSRLAIDQIEYGFCPGSPQPGSIDSIVVSTVLYCTVV